MTVTCKLYQKKSKAKPDGTAPIYLILRINNIEKLISTGKYVHVDHFDNATGKAKKGANDSIRLNAYLQAKLNELEKIVLEFQNDGRALTHDNIVSAFQSDGKQLFVDFCKSELEASKNTISKKYYDTTKYQLDKLTNFNPGLSFSQVNFEFLQKYEYFLIGKGNKPNTMKSDFVMIRKFLNLARKKG
jgi:hypothetical protein